jgi:2-polyprenyl-6-methoxyphenol hydroxylase-like FAD-dependent oxidoreductase
MLALWLTRRGVAVRIIDRNAGPADYSRALGVQARTLEFYRQLGIADRAVSGGEISRAANMWAGGTRAARIELATIGDDVTPYPFILDYAQNDHERMLIAAVEAAGIRVERNTELLDFEERAEQVHARVSCNGVEEIIACRWLAGCDGAHSRVRSELGISFPGGTYEQLFYVADVEATGAQVNEEIHINLDSADLLVMFPMKGRGHVRLVGTVVGRDAADMTFDNVAQRPIEQMHLTIQKVNWFSPYRVHHRVANSFRRGRAFLLGDAAHIHSPVGAQGMNTGIADAVNLAWKVAAVEEGMNPELLSSYETERIAFARRIVSTTDRVFTMAMDRSRFAAFVRTRIFPHAVSQLAKRRATRRFIFRTLSQTGWEYHHNLINEGGAGELRAGARLPWIGARGGVDNFAPLASLSWQVHVFGSPSPAVERACAEMKLPLHAFEFSSAARAAGFDAKALYLVRPDGYIGYAGAASNVDQMKNYWSRLFR